MVQKSSKDRRNSLTAASRCDGWELKCHHCARHVGTHGSRGPNTPRPRKQPPVPSCPRRAIATAKLEGQLETTLYTHFLCHLSPPHAPIFLVHYIKSRSIPALNNGIP